MLTDNTFGCNFFNGDHGEFAIGNLLSQVISKLNFQNAASFKSGVFVY